MSIQFVSFQKVIKIISKVVLNEEEIKKPSKKTRKIGIFKGL